MKKCITYLLAAGLAVGLLSGCGGEYTGASGENGVVSGGAVSGQAVSKDQAVNSEKTEKSHRYCTDTNLYVDCGDWLLQTRLDGTHKKKIKLKDYVGLIGIREGYLYYEVDTENGGVCRAPIGKDENGWDIVMTDQAENVISVEEKEGIYHVCGMNSKYIFYLTVPDIDKDNRRVVQYNIENGEKIELKDISEQYIVTDSYLIGCGLENIFVKEMNGKEWRQVSDYIDSWKSLGAVWNENEFFYKTPGYGRGWDQSTAVRKCDLTDSEDQEFISKKQLRQKAVEAEGIEMDEVDVCGIQDLFLEEDRLYVQVQLNWREEETYHVGVLMFSQGMEETELRYENEMMECLKMYGTTRKGEWGDDYGDGSGKKRIWEKNMIINDSRCFSIVNGKAFLWFYDGKTKYGRVGCYELERGTLRWLSEDQSEYYEPLYDESECTYGEDYEYTPDMPAYFPFYSECGAWGPKNESGGFYEDSED